MKAEVRIFIEVLSKLLDHGCTVRDALELMGKSSNQSFSGQRAKEILDSLSKGENLVDAFIASRILHEQKWRPFLLCFERTGNIRPSLELAIEFERSKKEWKSAICQATIYPSIISLIAIAAIAFLFLKGIPLMIETGFIRDAVVIAEMKGGVASSALVLIASSLSLIFGLSYALANKKRKQAFWETLKILSAEDIPLESCLSLCEQSTGIPYEQTGDLYFFDSPQIDPYTSATLLSARLTGDFQNAFKIIASYHSENLKSLYSIVSRLLEPVGIIVTGIIVLILSMTVFLPLFNEMGGIH